MSSATVLSEISRVLDTPIPSLDLNAGFIQNGGDSLSSVQLLVGLRRHGIQVPFETIFATDALHALAKCASTYTRQRSTHVIFPYQRAGFKRPHSEIESLSEDRLRNRHSTLQATRAQEPRTTYPMTEMQLSLIRSTQLHPGRNIISYREECDPEAIPAIKAAWKRISCTEPIFRMSLQVGEEAGIMCDYSDSRDYLAWDETVVFDEEAYLRAMDTKPQSTNVIQARITVITLQERNIRRRSTILYSFHHAYIDGVSFSLLLSQVKKCLRGDRYNGGSSFATFATQLKQIQHHQHDAAVRFWKTQKDKYSYAATQLLLPNRSGAMKKKADSLIEMEVESFPDQLVQRARGLGVTVASLYYAAWGLVLSKYTDCDQVCFGVVLSGRTLPFQGVETVIGPTINTMPLSIDLSRQASVGEFVTSIFAELLDLTTYQWSTPAHGFHRDFDSAINVRFHGPNSTLGSPSDAVECPHGSVISDIPIHVEVGNLGKVTLLYHAGYYARQHMACLAANFSNALKALLGSDSPMDVCLASIITNDQLYQLRELGNANSETTKHGFSEETLISLFQKCKESSPDELALQWRSGSMTYVEVDEMSSRVATALTKHIRRGDVVCVDADGSVDWIIAIYSVLKAGAVYFPLEPSVPDILRDANYKSAGAKAFLTTRVHTGSRAPLSCTLALSIEELSSMSNNSDLLLPDLTKPTSGAYLCFTSGSAGSPKGVLCRHDGLVAFQRDFSVRLCSRPGWKIAQFMSPGFDGSIHEIFSALSYGATLVLQDKSQPFEHLKKADCTILTPSVAQILDPTQYSNLKAVYLVGEAVPQAVCDHWADARQLWNMYGPTESTCGATIKQLNRGEAVTIGTPNPSSRIYILDRKKNLVAPGVIGEIYLAGVQVANGYIGRPQETSARFLPDSICPQYVEEYMYKTGDRAYWHESGELMLLGRSDRQIKLRGFRIDLDDLEIRIVRDYGECEAAAVAVDGDQLVAFVQPANLDVQSLRRDLSQHIPPYAIPRRIKAVTSFPRTATGKLDYSRVLVPDVADTASVHQSITGSEEKVLACLKESFGTTANDKDCLDLQFDDIGATSMTLISLTHRLSQTFGRKITIRTVLDCPSFRDLASALADSGSSNDPSKNACLGDFGVSPIEKDWWQKYQASFKTTSFNVSYSCGLPSNIFPEQLISAWDTVLGRHRILSCRYVKHGSAKIYNKIFPRSRGVEHIDVRKEVNRPFDLESEDLIRVFISHHAMLVVASHIICDLTTLRILLQEVADVYSGKELSIVVKEYAQHAWSVPASRENLTFWSGYLSGLPVPKYSMGKHVSRKDWTGSSYECQIPQQLYSSMLRFSSSRKFTMHQLALASIALTLQHKNTLCDIILGAPYLNRTSEADLKVVGLFLEPLPIRIQHPLARTSSKQISFMKSVQRSSRAALSHAVPWNQLLSHLGVEPDYPNNPLFDAMVTFHDCDQDLELPIDGITPQPTWASGSKFKIMAEFTVRDRRSLRMRLEYSDECFNLGDMRHMEQLIITALEGLVGGINDVEIVERLKSVHRPQEGS